MVELEGPEMKPAPALLALPIALMFASAPFRQAVSQQVADSSFIYPIAAPAYPSGGGPKVLIDEAHNNFHTMSGRFLAFARLLRSDGYVVAANGSKFTRGALDGARILVISNALAPENADGEWSLPTPSAFDSAEIAAVREWVWEGGSLWLIADHMPFPGAAGVLAAEFGVLMSNGFATDENEQDGRMLFSRTGDTRKGGTLADHPITGGRNDAERVDSIVSFTGQAFRLDAPGAPLMTLGRGNVLLLPEVAWQFSRLTQRVPASGMLQGAALSYGRGRVTVFGEAAMFSAQLAGPDRAPVGMNDPAAPGNPQFLLNIAHWLDGILK
jgi:hypothetical protein